MNKLIKFQLRNIFTSKYFYVLAFLTLLFSTGMLSISIDDPYYFPRIPWLEKVISILKGDMSLVGPRPERPFFVEKFREEIPRYMVKHQVRPGLTGWAQVKGYRGDTSIRKRFECDLYYIENWSIGFDIKIIFLTFFKGFVNKNAY